MIFDQDDHMRTLISSEKLRSLFEAHRDRDDAAFHRTADSIISEQLAANHHARATELKRALSGGVAAANGKRNTQDLQPIPRDRRQNEDLLWLQESQVTADRVTLSLATEKRVARVLDEHRKRLRLHQFGYRPKSKLLFWGPPGTGKTLTAFMLANELGLPIGVIRLSAVISSYLGDTASHLQRLFSKAGSTPMVLLLDEADALGKSRDDPNDIGELKRVVNSLLQSMDDFRSTDSILVAASNHQHLLDSALWRRFDDIVAFPLPGALERKRFLSFLLNGVRVTGSSASLVKRTASLSYAEIERVAIDAVKSMILSERQSLSVQDIDEELAAWQAATRGARRRPGVRQG